MSSAEAQVAPKPEPWTDDEIATAVRMWTDSRPSTEIATAVGKTRNAVIGRMHRIGCVRGKGIVDYSVSPKLVDPEPQAGSSPAPEPAPPPVPMPPPVEEPEEEPEDDKPQPLHSLDQMFEQAVESPPEPVQAVEQDEAPVVAKAPRILPTVEPVNFTEQVDLPNGQGKTPRPMKNMHDAPPDEGIPLLSVTGARCRYPMWSDMSTLPIEQKNVCGHRTVGITSWCEKHHAIVYEPPKRR